MNLRFQILLEKECIGTFNYIYFTDAEFIIDKEDSWLIYCHQLTVPNPLFLNEDSKITILGYVNDYNFMKYDFTVTKKIYLETIDCLMLEGLIDNSASFQYYDNELIDLIYFSNNNEYINSRKKHAVYNQFCAIYSGGKPKKFPNNKNIVVNCKEISTEYYFYTLIAEKLIGDKAYIGNNANALAEVLEESGIAKDNRNIINFLNYNEHPKFSNELIDILKEFGFTVNLLS